MNKKVKFNSKTVILVLLALIIMPVALAGWFDFLKGDITGRVPSTNTNLTLTIANTAAPKVYYVSPISQITLTAGTTTTVTFWFLANDSNGNQDLNDTTALVNFTLSSETARSASCTRTANMTSYSSNYSCSVQLQYYDQGSEWNVNVTISDSASTPNRAKNDTTTFDIMSSININSTPESTTWTSLDIGATNQNATSPINITNIGNQNITNITIKGYNFNGSGTAAGWIIGAGNFTASNNSATACQGNQIIDNTEVYYNTTIPRNGHGTTTKSIYYCIPTVPNVAAGTYQTTNTWLTTAKG